jgi:phosphoribosyl-ATP pyrophosphohydrolase
MSSDNQSAIDARVLERLFKVIESRKGASPDTSYTAKLLAGGAPLIGEKITEEAAETVAAALGEGNERLAAESADLLYHLLVLWAEAGLNPDLVWAELARREGTSGIAEKAARPKKD